MNISFEEKLREDWNYFKVEGEGALINWLRDLNVQLNISSEELVFFLNYKLMHGPKDSKYLALTGYKEVKEILRRYIDSNGKDDFYYMDAILGLSCFGDDSVFDIIEECLALDFKNSFCSKKYVFHWLEMLNYERSRKIVQTYKNKS